MATDKTCANLLTRKIYAAFDGAPVPGRLSSLCRDLVESQMESWPECRQGYEALKRVRVRDIPCRGFTVRLQQNPARIKSTTAEVGEKEVAVRPCFLCLPHLPEGQKGILYREDYLILCNPMPVFPSHFTVSHVSHRPQAVEENIHTFLALMADLGEPWTVLYNGPRCGASAPDDLHFQVIPSGLMPIEKEIKEARDGAPLNDADGVVLTRKENVGREVALLKGKDPLALAGVFRKLIHAFRTTLQEDREPMLSVAGRYDGEELSLIIFPRAKHRPDAFFREGEARIVVSPAVIEMGGVIVTPMEHDFNRLGSREVEAIFKEVSMDGKVVEAACRALT